MFVSQDLRFMYLTLPKSGSFTMEEVLRTHYGATSPRGSQTFHALPQHVPELKTPDFFVWTCVRHPLARALSLWNRCFREQDPYGWARQLGTREWGPFVEALAGRAFGGHYMAQTIHERFARPVQLDEGPLGDLPLWLDGFVRIERVAEDFGRLPFAVAGRPASWPRRNASSVRPQPRVTAGHEELIYAWAMNDYERFGYTPGRQPELGGWSW